MTDRVRITLLTDFGTADGYVAAMKGVLAREAPAACLLDAGHEVPGGDVRAGAWALAAYWTRYPPGTVHLVVVDPGVGSERRAVAVESEGVFLVGPDNGVLTPALTEGWRGVVIPWERDEASSSGHTFHGRDVFAPAAARLASGGVLADLGRPFRDPVRLEEPFPSEEGEDLLGEVVHVDRFGNLLTNLPGEVLTRARGAEVSGRRIPLGRSYADVEPGALLALVGSYGRVEVARRDGSAADVLGAARGTVVRVRGAVTRRRRASGGRPPRSGRDPSGTSR